ncbi:MAG TPA: efflux RND transporter periplasmic adaptor subunit [Chitinophagaceae bacterium]|nr:efflux RND transporter periplasmic adaptor subunit [Chitinophagaceae bacterium]
MDKKYIPGQKRSKLSTVIFLACFSWIVFAMSSCLLASCGSKKQGAASVSSASKSYGVIIAVPRTTVIYSDFPATIQGQQNVEIRPQIDGYMKGIYVDEGSVVKKGQLLFRISAPLYEQGVRTAEANIKIAQADLNAAQMEVNKVKPLVERNIISSYELQSAEYTLQSKQAALAQANATLINARTNLSYATIYSPADGVIGIIPFKIGALVSSTTTQPLTTVSNIQNIYAYFSINEKQQLDFLTNTKGNTLREKLSALPPVTLMLANGSMYDQKGRIETIGGLVNVPTGSVAFRATFQNPDGLIRSGSSATVQIPQTIDTALLVPQSATYQIQGKLFVYLAASDNTVHSTAIQVNSNASGHSYVVEQGLRPGDKIVVEGIGNLREGLAINPRVINADSVYARL